MPKRRSTGAGNMIPRNASMVNRGVSTTNPEAQNFACGVATPFIRCRLYNFRLACWRYGRRSMAQVLKYTYNIVFQVFMKSQVTIPIFFKYPGKRFI